MGTLEGYRATCVVFHELENRSGGDEDDDGEAADPAMLWSVATAESDDRSPAPESCRRVSALLHEDEHCRGERCRAPSALARIYLTPCSALDPDEAGPIKEMRARWRQEAPGEGSACLLRLLRADRARKAEAYVRACLRSRGPSHLENAVIERAASREDRGDQRGGGSNDE